MRNEIANYTRSIVTMSNRKLTSDSASVSGTSGSTITSQKPDNKWDNKLRGVGIWGARGAIVPLAFWKIGGFVTKFFIFMDKSVLHCTQAPLALSSFRRP